MAKKEGLELSQKDKKNLIHSINVVLKMDTMTKVLPIFKEYTIPKDTVKELKDLKDRIEANL